MQVLRLCRLKWGGDSMRMAVDWGEGEGETDITLSSKDSFDQPVSPATSSELLYRNVQRFRGGLVFKAHRLV